MDYNEYKKLTVGEQSLVDWQYRRCGGFESALWDAISRADTGNLIRLSSGFPEHIEAYTKYTRQPGWWGELMSRLYPREGDTNGS